MLRMSSATGLSPWTMACADVSGNFSGEDSKWEEDTVQQIDRIVQEHEGIDLSDDSDFLQENEQHERATTPAGQRWVPIGKGFANTFPEFSDSLCGIT